MLYAALCVKKPQSKWTGTVIKLASLIILNLFYTKKDFCSFLIAFLSFLSFLRLRTNDIPCLNKSTTMEKRKTTSSKVQSKLTSFYRVLKDFFLPFVNVSFSQQQPRYQSTWMAFLTTNIIFPERPNRIT